MTPIPVYYDPLFIQHETGEHPENKRRLIVAKRVLEENGLDIEWTSPEPAPLAAIERDGNDALAWPSLTVITTFEYVPIRPDPGDPHSRPVVELKFAHTGLLLIENVSGWPSGSRTCMRRVNSTTASAQPAPAIIRNGVK